MRFLFLPAIALMNRLSYLRKFGLLWLMSLVAIAVVLSNLYLSLNRQIKNAQTELEGIALAIPISQAVQVIQQRRGLYVGFVDRQGVMGRLLAAKEIEARDSFNALEAMLPRGLESSDDWQSIRANWQELDREGSGWTSTKNFAAHTRLIDQLLLFKVAVSGEYVLPLDPQVDTSYLIDASINRLPLALEHLGQIRAFGTNLLTQGQLTGAKKVTISTWAAQLRDELRFLRADFERAGQYNPDLQPALRTIANDIAASIDKIIGLVQSDIVTGKLATSAQDFFTLNTDVIDKGYVHLHQSLLPTIEALIKARIARAETTLRLSIGIAALLFLVVIYFSIGAYYATIGNIRSLGRSARAFAGGKLGERVALETRDELKQVGDSFNVMAEGFSALMAAHQEDETRYRAIVDTALDAIVQMDEQGTVTGWNLQAEAIFGWSRQEAIGRLMHETIIPPQYRQAHIDGVKRFLATGEGALMNSRLELLGLHRDGREFPVEVAITTIRKGARREFSAFIRDITQKKESEALIWRQANYDALTGLPNRHMFYARLEQDIKKASRTELGIAVLFVDLDRFKEVNDTLGHRIGDFLLIEAADRIRGCVRESDTVARWGGDEFVVVMADIGDSFCVERVAMDILRRLAEPFRLENETTYLSASIGITLYPRDAVEIEELLKQADQAMYLAKNTGRNRFSYFTPELQTVAQTRLRLINDLRDALAAQQFELHFQPIVSLETGQIQKAEALIRWRHPERGLVSPGEFIALAEQTGLIVPIGAWVVDAVCAQQAAWLAARADIVPVAVNLSPVQFANGDLLSIVDAALARCGLDAKYLEVELTESLVMQDPEMAARTMAGLRQRGLRLSLDDFGTGYSSLAYLQRFPFDSVKIDQTFIRDITRNPGSAAIATAVIAIAQRLDLRVVAEGVEDEEQVCYLRLHGCDQIQGYHFSPPLPALAFAELLASGRRLPCARQKSALDGGVIHA